MRHEFLITLNMTIGFKLKFKENPSNENFFKKIYMSKNIISNTNLDINTAIINSRLSYPITEKNIL